MVNFGGGSYVLYAEFNEHGEIEVDPEPYSDNFDRPARLLPVEAKAIGEPACGPAVNSEALKATAPSPAD